MVEEIKLGVADLSWFWRVHSRMVPLAGGVPHLEYEILVEIPSYRSARELTP